MSNLLNIFNNREIAIGTWIVLIIIIGLFTKPLQNFIKSAFPIILCRKFVVFYGKSTLLKEAYFQSKVQPISDSVFGVYLSLRSLPLLRSNGQDYEQFFCNILLDKIRAEIEKYYSNCITFDSEPEVDQSQFKLSELSINIQKRIVLFFDDAAHIGRETSLKEFFDIFRTLSNNIISCKAAIYPGVTEFGPRFDLLNDANVIDISRNEESASFTTFFQL